MARALFASDPSIAAALRPRLDRLPGVRPGMVRLSWALGVGLTAVAVLASVWREPRPVGGPAPDGPGTTPADPGADRLDLALRTALTELTDRTGVRLDLVADPLPARSVDERNGVIRIAREAVRNAARHSGAAAVRVTLTGSRGVRGLEVVDDGCGFDRAAVHRGFGLRSMHERASALGGEWSLHSVPGAGTTIRLIW